GQLRLPRLAVLPGREVALLDRALLGIAALALEEQLHRLAAAEPADRTDITSHLHSPPLRRTASVVRDGRHVADRFHFDTDRLERADRRLAAGPGALDAHVERPHADGLGDVTGGERCLGRRK